MVDRTILSVAQRRINAGARREFPDTHFELEPAGHGWVRVAMSDSMNRYIGPTTFTVRVSRRAGVREVVRRVIAGLERMNRLPPVEFDRRHPYRAGAS